MTLSEHEGHFSGNQTIEFNRVQHHNKFETSPGTSMPTQDNVNHICYKLLPAEYST